MPANPSTPYLTPEELEIQARAEKARKGPWLFTHHDHAIADTGDHDHCDSITAEDGCFVVADIWTDDSYSCQNAEFIAAARTDIPKLLDSLAAARRELAELRELISAISVALDDTKADSSGWFRLRRYLRGKGVYEGNLQSEAVIIEACSVALLSAPPQANGQEKP